MRNKVIKYGIMVVLIIVGFFLGYEVSGNFRFVPLSPPITGPEILYVASIDNNHVNVFSNFSDWVYIVKVTNQKNEVGSITSIGYRVDDFNRKGRVFNTETAMTIFGFEDLSLTQVGIPSRGQANIIFESEENQVLTIEYYMKATDTETKLIVKTFELQDNGSYKWRR